MLKEKINLGVVANALEWVDYALYGAFSSVMAPLFFPQEDALASQLDAFGVFALGFIARPLGGALFGHIGDKTGRENALFISIILMAIPTACICFLPTYEQAGFLASLLLIVIRILQGLAIGGEYTGAMVSLVENAPVEKRGQLGSWADIGCLIGTLLGGQLIAIVLSSLLSPENYQTWGWRLPFFLSFGLVYVGFRLKQTVKAPPQKATSLRIPLVDVFKKHTKSALYAMFIVSFSGISFYNLLVFFPNYLVVSKRASPFEAFLITGITNACMIPVTFFTGRLTDLFKKRKVFLQIGAWGILLLAYPITATLQDGSLWIYGILHVLSGVFLSFYYGGRTAFFAETFPAHVRCTAVSIALGIGQAIAGGTAPFVATYLVNKAGDARIVAAHFAVGACFALYALAQMADRTAQPLE
ncbi:MAG: MFS transporter [Holosporales bacterium]|jgi:MHS family proline/betaine transporter-like MFS transporter|nr:MFS transporter [Holosporales bacterium]